MPGFIIFTRTILKNKSKKIEGKKICKELKNQQNEWRWHISIANCSMTSKKRKKIKKQNEKTRTKILRNKETLKAL
jgi:uncharacterized protein YmfQ (DUF2313 family)